MKPVPKYRQIINDIRTKIESGELKSGDSLDSTKNLQTFYGVSMTTVHYAAMRLEVDGFIESVPGVGRFVK